MPARRANRAVNGMLKQGGEAPPGLGPRRRAATMALATALWRRSVARPIIDGSEGVRRICTRIGRYDGRRNAVSV